MKIYDLHTHTTYSDGCASLELLTETADRKGYGLGVSDHLFCGGMNTLYDIRNYLEALQAYPEVLRGGEANAGEDYSMPAELDKQFDYIITSVHSVPDLEGGRISLGEYFGERGGNSGVKWNWNIQKNRCEEYLENILPEVKWTMENQRMDIYGHCTVLPFCEILQNTSFLRDWENELIGLCKRYEIALEISGLWKEPGKSMILRAKEAGLKFTFGSDCHVLKSVCNLEYPLQVYKTLGLTEQDLFLPVKHR